MHITRWATIIRTTPPADNNATSDKNQADKTSKGESRLVELSTDYADYADLLPGIILDDFAKLIKSE